ncbi:MAG: PAS domain S-box protein [Chloroflexi bacterium]|nr:PAS domain S-box protein [Chloroflexota bacterium]
MSEAVPAARESVIYRQQAEALEARMRGLLDAAPDAMVGVNQDGYIVLANLQTFRMFGYAREELLGQPVEFLVPERFRAAHQGHRQGYFADPRTRPMGASLELFGLHKSGRELPIEISLNPVETEFGPLTMSAIRDISDRKSAEARFRTLLESAPDAIVITDSSGTIRLVNAQTEALFGYPRERLLGQSVELLVPERYRHAHVRERDAYADAPRTRPMGAGLDLIGLRSDGAEFPVEISLSPMETADGLIVMSTIRDVTEQRAAAERAHLLVQERIARTQAEEAVRARNEFLSVAAHELKTPITSLRVFAELLLRQLDQHGSVEPQRLRMALATIDQQSHRISRLIDQLLDLSRIEGGRLTVALEPADLVVVVRMVADAIQVRTSRHIISLDSPDTVLAQIDTLRIEQVLTNLLDNAIKYSPEGGDIQVTIRQPDADCTVTQISIRDRGIGIPAESRAHIFDRFYQAREHNSTSGMGLGLYISRQIVELHGGEIAVESPPDGGSCFTVTLPTQAGRASASAGTVQ